MKRASIISLLILFLVLSLSSYAKETSVATFYCEYCGMNFASVRALTAARCPRHPLGPNKGFHKVYEGTEKPQYTCKYCGFKFSTIRAMTAARCPRHPSGPNKGYHAPTL
jgi:predicted Zn-ribbon and HTH transcriptional regulator